MGTKDDTTALQARINELRKMLGWTLAALSRTLYVELHEIDDEEEMRRFGERFKKEMSRPTTCPGRLAAYLDIMMQLPEVQRLDRIVRRHVPHGAISATLSREISHLGWELDVSAGQKSRSAGMARRCR